MLPAFQKRENTVDAQKFLCHLDGNQLYTRLQESADVLQRLVQVLCSVDNIGRNDNVVNHPVKSLQLRVPLYVQHSKGQVGSAFFETLACRSQKSW
jgi:hypothetical protein